MVKVLKGMPTVILAFVVVAMCGACDKSKDSNQTVEQTVETTTEMTTTEATTSLEEHKGPLPSNTVKVTWKETALDNKKMTVKVTGDVYLNVRTGAGTQYDAVGSMTDGMEVVVVAKTDNNWYKTADGFYVAGTFLKESK